MKRLQIYIDEDLDEALAERARRERTSKAALIRDLVRRSVVKGGPPEDPFRDWIVGSDADLAPVDETVYGQPTQRRR